VILLSLRLAIVAGMVILGTFGYFGQRSQDNDLSEIGRKHVAELISALPPDTSLRLRLESGEHGDGVLQSWMVPMSRQGVKRAVVSVRFANLHEPQNMSIEKILFFDKYDTDCAQITDLDHIKNIRASGLDQILKEEAISRTVKLGKWLPEQTPHESGLSTIEFYDDAWLWHGYPFLSPPSKDRSKLNETARDETALRNALATKKFSLLELDQALMYAAATVDDSCILKPLITAGASPNAVHYPGGNTALMNAAGAGQLRNVRVLLKA
jgi:hypothetical protein